MRTRTRMLAVGAATTAALALTGVASTQAWADDDTDTQDPSTVGLPVEVVAPVFPGVDVDPDHNSVVDQYEWSAMIAVQAEAYQAQQAQAADGQQQQQQQQAPPKHKSPSKQGKPKSSKSAPKSQAPVDEDSPKWDCRVNGNHICGPFAPLPGGEVVGPEGINCVPGYGKQVQGKSEGTRCAEGKARIWAEYGYTP